MVTAGNNWQPKDPEVARLRDRLAAAEAALSGRIAALEEGVKQQWRQEEEARAARKTRTWQIALAVVTGLVLPVAVVGILALLHLGG